MPENYIILIHRNKRKFYANDSCELTWRKEFAMSFESVDAAKTALRDDRRLQLVVRDHHEIIPYSTAKSY